MIFFRPSFQLLSNRILGDSSGFMHVGPGQEVVISHQDDLPFMNDIYIYEDGILYLPPAFTCYDINIYVW